MLACKGIFTNVEYERRFFFHTYDHEHCSQASYEKSNAWLRASHSRHAPIIRNPRYRATCSWWAFAKVYQAPERSCKHGFRALDRPWLTAFFILTTMSIAHKPRMQKATHGYVLRTPAMLPSFAIRTIVLLAHDGRSPKYIEHPNAHASMAFGHSMHSGSLLFSYLYITVISWFCEANFYQLRPWRYFRQYISFYCPGLLWLYIHLKSMFP